MKRRIKKSNNISTTILWLFWDNNENYERDIIIQNKHKLYKYYFSIKKIKYYYATETI